MTTGHDVGKDRLDDVDRMVLRDSLGEPFSKTIIANMGSGESSLSVALAAVGHRVYNYDCRDLSVFFAMEQERGTRQVFTQIDLLEIKKHHLPKQLEICVFQRVLHYLKYQQTQKLLQTVTHNLKDGGAVYLSFSGLESEIGRTYTDRGVRVEDRWGSIDPEYQEKFSIEQQLCLYDQTDVEQLIDSVDNLNMEQIWVSDFGNIKCVARKTESTKTVIQKS